MLFVEMYLLLSGLFIGQIWEQVAQQRLLGFESAYILLRALGHEPQTDQRVSQSLVQGAQQRFRLCIDFRTLSLVAQITSYLHEILFTQQPEVLCPE